MWLSIVIILGQFRKQYSTVLPEITVVSCVWRLWFWVRPCCFIAMRIREKQQCYHSVAHPQNKRSKNWKFTVMKIYSVSESSGSPYIQELRELLEEAWGSFSAFEMEDSGMRTPLPLIAIENEVLIGGLVYSLWSKTETERKSIWINGLIIKPSFRNNGIATQLIKAAMINQSLLFVLAEIPHLYSKIGWEPVSKGERGTVLKYQS